MILAILTAVAGLLVGILVAIAWLVGHRQGRADVLAVARTLGTRTLGAPTLGVRRVEDHDLLSSDR